MNDLKNNQILMKLQGMSKLDKMKQRSDEL